MERYFINDGVINVHVTEWGNRTNPVIFCLHGLGCTSLSFIEIADQLKDEFRVISIDAPGHGKTDSFDTEEKYELPSLAKWLNRIVEMLNIETFYFLSHSWGSFAALFYLLTYPKKVKGSILIDGGYQTKRLKDQSLEEEVSYYEKDFEEYVETWEQFLEEAVYGEVTSRSALLDLAAKDLALEKDNRFYWHARGKTAGYFIKAMHKHETVDIYENLPSNILLLRATLPESQDDYRNLTSKIFEQKTGGTVKLIPNASHMLHWDHPDRVVNEVREQWAKGY